MYDAGCNLFWLKLESLPVPAVPLNDHGIDIAIQNHFMEPKPYLQPITVAVGPDEDGESIERKKGNLQLVSPPEVVHGLVRRVAARIAEGAEDAELARWKQVFLTVTFVFELLEKPEDRYFRSVNLHEKMVGDFEAMARDVAQRVMELVSYKELMKREHNQDIKNNQELFHNWSTRVTQVKSKFSEAVTLNFVDTAMKVYNRMLKRPELLRIVMEDRASLSERVVEIPHCATDTGMTASNPRFGAQRGGFRRV